MSFCLWLFVKIFLFQVFIVPTASMNNALIEGDYILVNKLAFGSRLPITPLSFRIGNKKYFLDWIQLSYFRFPGYSSIKHDDILVFNLPSEYQYPIDEKKESVKRCIGLPGDIIVIKNGNIYINGKYKDEPNILKWYSFKTNGKLIDSLCLKNFSDDFDFYKEGETETFISATNATAIGQCKDIVSITKKNIPKENYSPNYFPNAPQIKWNPDNFGSYYIPRKGQSIRLNKNNLLLYQYIIEKYENNILKFEGDSVFINNKYSDFYIFKMDYFCALGDNRYNSIDSRFWGLIPESHLIGKAEYILFSSPNSGFQKTKRSSRI